jgi:hypothetical protein
MGRDILAPLALLMAMAVSMTACDRPDWSKRKPREEWRDRAEAICLKSGAVRPSAYVRPMRPINGPGSCGARRPFQVGAAMGGRVALSPAATLGCPMIPQVDSWLARDVQPAAMSLFGEPVAAIDVAASYSSRSRNGKRGAKMSEHAYTNALDVRAFRLASGRTIEVERGWSGPLDEAVFLRTAHQGACRRFRTIIGPDGDRYHRDHFHLDLAWHGKDDVYCR